MQDKTSVDSLQQLFQVIVEQYTLSLTGVHGVKHWARVCENGLRLATESNADREVVTLFALFHDACRESDGHDPNHGSRGAQLAKRLRGQWFEIDDARFELLCEACHHHTDGVTSAEPTLATCWDADRLDLGRVGLEPHSRYLSTAMAKRRDVIVWATGRSQMNYVPDLLHADWGYQP